MKIQFQLTKFERALGFQIREMDERFRNAEYGSNNSFNGEYFAIRSNVALYWNHDQICLRGVAESRDLDVDYLEFLSNKDRDKAHKNIISDLKLWASTWPGFKGEPIQEKVEGDIYEF